MVECLLYIYSKTRLDRHLTEKEAVILREYVMNGFSDVTKKSICISLGIKNRKNLDVFNHRLQNKGFLLPHPRNQQNKVLSEDMQRISDFYKMDNSKKLVIVDLINGLS